MWVAMTTFLINSKIQQIISDNQKANKFTGSFAENL